MEFPLKFMIEKVFKIVKYKIYKILSDPKGLHRIRKFKSRFHFNSEDFRNFEESYFEIRKDQRNFRLITNRDQTSLGYNQPNRNRGVHI